MNYDNLDWGNIPDDEKQFYIKECKRNDYEKHFRVEEGDLVVDIGVFVGSFTYGILDRKPEHCWVMEPVESHFRKLYKNLKSYPVSFIRGAISDKPLVEIEWIGEKSVVNGINFKEFTTNNCIDKIDFLKIDCEGGEYMIFNKENVSYLKNVKKIAGEFHMRSPELKIKFRYFRDNILTQFSKYYIYSHDGVDIKWDLFNEHFIQYYKEILIHIDNR